MSRGRKALRAVVVFFIAGISGLVGWVEYCAHRTYEAPYPPLVADVRPEALARGRKLFEAKCAGCHVPEGAGRAIGKTMADVPPELGVFRSANLTRDTSFGIGSFTDAEIARAVRYGVTRDGRRSVMGWALSDDDLSAVIGYLRSDAAVFDADATVQPHSETTFVGKMVLAFVLGGPRALPASGIVAPPESEPAAYGEYLAKQVYDCADCHSPGFAPNKANGEDGFRGGMQFVGADGKPIFSRNLTFHSSGLAGWSQDDFARALHDGLSRDGQPLRAPMPKFPALDEAEVRGLYAFLQSLPHRESGAPPRPAVSAPVARVHPGAALFQKIGCIACHSPGNPLEDKVIAARGRDVAELARWIRNAQAIKPGSAMPSFASVLSEEQAVLLAEWISAGRPEVWPLASR